MTNLAKTVKIDILGNVYEVPFPKTGQFIDIQTVKAKLTEGHYDTFRLLQNDGLMAGIIVDTIATYNILIGDKLKKDLNVKGLLDLEMDKIIEIAYSYKDFYIPFYDAWMELISKPKTNPEDISKETTVA